MIEAPIPWWTPFCGIAYPASVLLALTLLIGMRIQPRARLPGAIVLGFVLWAAAVHCAALARGGFYAGLAWGSALIVLAGLLWPEARRAGRRLPRAFAVLDRNDIVLACAGLVLIAPGAIFFDIYDKTYSVYGHFYFVNNLLNGAYPPRDPVFPDQLLSYHYGTDLVAAMVAAVLPIGVPWSFSLLVMVLWPCGILLSIALARTCLPREYSRLAAFVMAFGGGLPWLAALSGASHDPPARPFMTGQILVNAPDAAYFFQHPWTIGLPLLLLQMLILVRCDRFWPRGTVAIAGSVLLGWASAFFNSVVAAMMVIAGAAMLAKTVMRAVSRRGDGRGVADVLPALAITAGFLLGAAIGLLASGLLHHVLLADASMRDAGVGGLIFAPLSLAGSRWESLIWIVASGGALFPVGLAGIYGLRRGRVSFAAVLTFSVMMPLLFRYAYSWDIVKFQAAGMMLAAFPFIAALARLLRNATGAIRLAVLILLPAAACMDGLVWCLSLVASELTHDVRTAAIDGTSYRNTIAWRSLSPDDFRTIPWLRTHMLPYEIVYVPESRFLGYGIYGGLPQFHIDFNGEVFQRYRKDILAARSRSAAESGEWPELLRWFVLRTSDPKEHAIMLTLEQNHIAAAVKQFGDVVVYRRLDNPVAGAMASRISSD